MSVGSVFGEDGRYRLEEVLGVGGMASVWLARDGRLGRPVAIKVLSDVLALDADFVARFEREARIAASLSHPHLVSVFDCGVHETRPYLVMEYVEGGTLADRLAGAPDQDWDREALFDQLLDALGYVHAAGIIHRDVKPANVLIGNDDRARLTDFGIARPSAASRLTNTGLVLGTARYIAPEVLRGRPADARSDLYACGVLFDECLRSTGPSRLRLLAERLTATQPELRPSSAGAARRLLHAGSDPTAALPRTSAQTFRRLAPETVAAPAPPDAGRPSRIVPRARTAGILAGVLAAIVVSVSIAAGGGSPRAAVLKALPAGAPLAQQLDHLDATITRARR